jgi:hypothetical protein
MYYVYFARGYANEEMVAEFHTLQLACSRADLEFVNGCRDVGVYDAQGVKLYVPEMDDEGFLI